MKKTLANFYLFGYFLASIGMLLFYYQLLMPFSILLVDDISEYRPEWWHEHIYFQVLENPFKSPTMQASGKNALFDVAFIYYFGGSPEATTFLKCGNIIYPVPINGDKPKVISEKGKIARGVSNYNFIVEEAKDKYCHLEFQLEWELAFSRTLHKTLKTEEFFVY